jgi:hypothetical protein
MRQCLASQRVRFARLRQGAFRIDKTRRVIPQHGQRDGSKSDCQDPFMTIVDLFQGPDRIRQYR